MSFWKVGVSGDWFTPANWSGGVPTSSTDVFINAFGTYTVTLSAAAAANSVTLNSGGATLSESSGGTLTVAGLFEVAAGTALLDGDNTFAGGLAVLGQYSTAILNGVNEIGGNIEVANSAVLDVGNSGALSTAPI